MTSVLIDPLGDASNLPDEICIHILSQLSCFELRNLRAVNKHYHNLVNVCFETRRNILRRTIAQIHSTVKSWNHEQPVPWNLTPETIDRIVDTRFEPVIIITETDDMDYDDEDYKFPIRCITCSGTCNFVPVVSVSTSDYHFCFRCVTTNLKGVLAKFTPLAPGQHNLLVYAMNYNVLRIMSGSIL
jgi:hypothetical protein